MKDAVLAPCIHTEPGAGTFGGTEARDRESAPEEVPPAEARTALSRCTSIQHLKPVIHNANLPIPGSA